MEHSIEENAGTADLEELHKIVLAAKHDEEVSVKMIEALERERYWRRQGRREGIKEGIKEGQAIERVNTERECQRADYEKKMREKTEYAFKELQKKYETLLAKAL